MLKKQISQINGRQDHGSLKIRNCELSLRTGGPEMRVVLNGRKVKPATFDSESLDNFRISTGVSMNHMIKMTSFIRHTTGEKSIPVNYRAHLSEKSKALESLYKAEIHEFDVEVTPVLKREKRPIIYADAQELLEYVLEERSIIGDFNIKVLCDSGQGFLKLSMSVFPRTQPISDDSDDIELKPKRCSFEKQSKLT
ncbi:hypothetical protein QAD02_003690 [Eretmocerus hayati]|uniref:Uncharacterized protein n=1 Tax=Eretmocerus hayati TaxID=131215 RepID=A0ACC2NP87_9HYME|nr:hypothetical protein QAD02_003690 [Eretmocerus hayati]